MNNQIISNQIFAYIFDELSEAENNQVEDLIIEDEDFGIQVSDLIKYCRAENIQSSVQLLDHLDFLRHQFFHNLMKEGISLPEILKEKYQNVPVKKLATPLLDNDKKTTPNKRNRNWIWLFSFVISGIVISLLFIKYTGNDSDIQSPPPEINTGNSSEINEDKSDQDNLDKSPFENSIPEKTTKEALPEKQEKIEPPVRNNSSDSKEPILANAGKDEFIKEHQSFYPISKLTDNASRNNIRSGVTTEEEWIIEVNKLIQKDSAKILLDDSEYFEIGRYYLKYHNSQDRNFEKTLQYFEKVNEKLEPSVNWLKMHTYIFQDTPTSLELAKKIFQEKIITDSRRRIQKYVTEMPIELKAFLLENK